jgi:hypothetical protein
MANSSLRFDGHRISANEGFWVLRDIRHDKSSTTWRIPMKTKQSSLYYVRSLVFGLSIAVTVFLAGSAQASASTNSQLRLSEAQTRQILRATGLSYQAFQRLIRSGAITIKTIKGVTKGCGCAVTPDDSGGFGVCFKGCLQDAGVTPIDVVLCGASCALAETGAGLIICAICVGLNVTAVEFCALGCAAGNGGGDEFITKNLLPHRPMQRSNRAIAKLRRNSSRTIHGT